jgi:hypothetical protein
MTQLLDRHPVGDVSLLLGFCTSEQQADHRAVGRQCLCGRRQRHGVDGPGRGRGTRVQAAGGSRAACAGDVDVPGGDGAAFSRCLAARGRRLYGRTRRVWYAGRRGGPGGDVVCRTGPVDRAPVLRCGESGGERDPRAGDAHVGGHRVGLVRAVSRIGHSVLALVAEPRVGGQSADSRLSRGDDRVSAGDRVADARHAGLVVPRWLGAAGLRQRHELLRHRAGSGTAAGWTAVLHALFAPWV